MGNRLFHGDCQEADEAGVQLAVGPRPAGPRPPARSRQELRPGVNHGFILQANRGGSGVFVSAWLLMVFAGIVGTDVGVHPFGYVTSMVVTIALWLAIAPAIGAVARGTGTSKHKGAAG
jgi:hypothetical protein